MARRLEGKVALVTGASSGIGEATALALAAEGARVAAAARRKDRLDALVKRIEEQGGQAIPLVVDVSDETQVRDMVRRARDAWGRVDMLVNDAGVAQFGYIDGANTDSWRQMVNINLLGLMYVTREVLPLMKAQGDGHIVNISSVAGRTVRENNAVYSATKWGVGAFSEALRLEANKHHIRVTVIEPGFVATEIQEHLTDPVGKAQIQEWTQSMTPLASEDIAAAIVYAVTQPGQVDVNEMLIRPTEQVR
jgi:NADP-dependent 3-hydroxy acid dehydrogenase YdfG